MDELLKKQTILIVDDSPENISVLGALLRLDYTVRVATNGEKALKIVESDNPPDLILLDVMMPGMDGFEVCKNLRKSVNTKDIPIVLLTAKGQIEDKITGFNSGADDYLVKPFDIQELLVRIRALLRRTHSETPSLEEVIEVGDIRLFPDSLEVRVVDKTVKLTPTEFELLYCLMQHVNQAVNLATLLNEVWGYDADEDVRMVRVHMGGLRQKIEPDPKVPRYVQTVTNVGYKLIPWLDIQNG